MTIERKRNDWKLTVRHPLKYIRRRNKERVNHAASTRRPCANVTVPDHFGFLRPQFQVFVVRPDGTRQHYARPLTGNISGSRRYPTLARSFPTLGNFRLCGAITPARQRNGELEGAWG